MEKEQTVLTLPVAIVVAAVIIGGALFMTRGGQATTPIDTTMPATAVVGAIDLRAVDENDHMLGNPNAKIVMVEYSDLECPFCKAFHKTMHSVLDTYGKNGDTAWVYRHFPLDIHPKAPKEAEAAECAFEQGGNTAFWNYVNKIFEITPGNNGLDAAQLPKTAKDIGLDVTAFQTCLDSGKYAQKIKTDYNDGLAAGVNGTPHTVLMLKKEVNANQEKSLAELNQTIMRQLTPGTPDVITIDPTKRKVGVSGNFQYSTVKQIIELLLD